MNVAAVPDFQQWMGPRSIHSNLRSRFLTILGVPILFFFLILQMSVKLLCDDVIEENHHEPTMSLNEVGSVVESPVELVGDENTQFEDDNKPMVQSVNPNVVGFIQPKEGKTEFVDQKSNQGTTIPEQNAAIDNKHQIFMKLLCDDGIDESEKEKEGLISEEDDSYDDWEGVERSDLEKMFAMAADYGKEDAYLQNLGNETQMQLYGLHKVDTEGPCHEAQHMALKLSARSKC
ncbi:hypothetical protein L2E82_28326 [Cichorium intybus]|uniref:Uncharacterized protein n=1 Tax=Cichorium intybus TaxID=13427 RepID=A0ACB9CVI1_CICIN|nr:hypothetical protein L2E82_28326 [Cichorium intybus]